MGPSDVNSIEGYSVFIELLLYAETAVGSLLVTSLSFTLFFFLSNQLPLPVRFKNLLASRGRHTPCLLRQSGASEGPELARSRRVVAVFLG